MTNIHVDPYKNEAHTAWRLVGAFKMCLFLRRIFVDDVLNTSITVLRIVKLKLFPVPVRFGCGSGRLNFCHYFIMFCNIDQRCT